MNWTCAVCGIASVFGALACSGGDGGSDKASSPLTGDDQQRQAVISVRNYDQPNITGHVAFADMSLGRYGGPGSKCKTETEGLCTLQFCESVPVVDPEHPPVLVSAGTISLRGARIPAGSSFEPLSKAEPHYPKWAGPEVIWSGGEDVHIAAEGDPDGVPAFEATLKAPSLIALSKPHWHDEDGLVIQRAKGLALAWTPAAAASGNVTVTLVANASGPSQASTWQVVDCSFPVSSGAAEVPPSILEKVQATDYGSVWIQSAEDRVVSAGDWSVKVQLRSSVERTDAWDSMGSARFR